MFDPNHFESLTKKLFSVLPPSVQAFENEIQQQFKAILTATFAKMDLVTREEFDVQINVLARTREKVEALQHSMEVLIRKE